MVTPHNSRLGRLVFDRLAGAYHPGTLAKPLFALVCLGLLTLTGCAMTGQTGVSDTGNGYAPGTILESKSGRSIEYSQLINELDRVQVVYIGEQHTNSSQHEIQLRIIHSLLEKKGRLVVGMEMFDTTYQPVLERWSRGGLEWAEFIKQTHWYANWKYPAELYRPLLMAIQDKHLVLFGLNLPFHIPPKIAQGGIDSLSSQERAFLPGSIDTTNSGHRAYLEEVFQQHRFTHQRDFTFFYEAQCAWEETMAQSIADNLDNDPMVVLVGNGHIFRHFGIPDRAFKRSGAPFLTVYTVTPQTPFSLQDGDFIFVTEARGPARP